MNRNSTHSSFLPLLITILGTEILFHLLSFGPVIDAAVLRILAFGFAQAAVFSAVFSLFPSRAEEILTDVLCFAYTVLALLQLQFKNYIGNYMSLKASLDGAGRITQFVGQFLTTFKPQYFLVLIPFLLILLFRKKHIGQENTRPVTGILIMALLLELCAFGSVQEAGLSAVYTRPAIFDTAMKEFGFGRLFLMDLVSLADTGDVELIVHEEEEEPQEIQEEILQEEDHRYIDDTRWQELADAEEDEDIKRIDSYMMKRKVTDRNEYTGMYAGKNVIYIMIEAFDYMALDPELTPTLYMMKEEGWDFANHYTPMFSCATGESEFVSLYSIAPQSDVCTPNEYRENAWNESLFHLFGDEGYYVSAYHNWRDEFYDRRILYESSGCPVYYNYDDMDYHTIQGWQSDLEMMELTVPLYIDKDRFFTHYVTSSMHYPYDSDSVLGNRYLEEINAVHPEYPIEVKRYLSKVMEFDRSLAYLLDELEKAGKTEDTLIVMFADHHPLRTSLATLAEYTHEVDRYEGLNEHRTPLIMYSKGMSAMKNSTVNSTFDILPTVANLCDLSYDPRFYIGTDIFSEDEKTVYFPNGDWVTEHGYYLAFSSTFTPFTDTDEAYIQRKNEDLQNVFAVSWLILQNDYFDKRKDLVHPKLLDDQ